MERAKDVVNEGEERARKVVSDIEKKLKENPWPALAVVAVSCTLLGVLLGNNVSKTMKQ
ncbi:MAG: hypothetical protein PHE18_01405 [Candidatus Omnitrophica bacterium]|nr:hypothetical protein [Candidatus Omnitrophota bacterium]MDD5552512.1 hypothetical protein [Candidatus Omnitrophota bacterium]